MKFLRQIDRETPKKKTLHLIADNYATHKHPVVQAWLESAHTRFIGQISGLSACGSWSAYAALAGLCIYTMVMPVLVNLSKAREKMAWAYHKIVEQSN